jgi:hypothetical protein
MDAIRVRHEVLAIREDVVMSLVTEVAAAPAAEALAHIRAEFAFETDCWDVHAALSSGNPDFVLLDVRGREAFDRGHVAGATSLPHSKIIASKLAAYPADTLFVV